MSAASCATLWCAAFAGLHLYWAVGGSAGLASSAGRDLATRRPTTFVIVGLYGVTLLLLVGIAIIGLASTERLGRYHGALVALLGVVGVLLLVRGVVLEVVLAENGAVRTQVGPLESHWSQILWNPWFGLGGALFIATALQLHRHAPRRRLSR